MSITRKPSAGRVLMCDFSGAIHPEMYSDHNVVVISEKKKNLLSMCLVVPISSKSDFRGHDHHVELNDGDYPFIDRQCWIKTDLVRAVSFDRLTTMPERHGGSNAKINKTHLTEIIDKLKNYIDIS